MSCNVCMYIYIHCINCTDFPNGKVFPREHLHSQFSIDGLNWSSKASNGQKGDQRKAPARSLLGLDGKGTLLIYRVYISGWWF